MEKDGEIFISNSVKIDVLRSLQYDRRLRERENMEFAIKFFRDRIQGRYFNQIYELNHNTFVNGFTSMAICCLLIDTFYQFENGVKKTTDNKHCYTSFLRDHLGDVFDTQEKAERFYVDIRCGILHSAQTQNGSRLSCSQHDTLIVTGNDATSPISVSVEKFTGRLWRYFNDYCDRVRYDRTTQSNFVKKIRIMFKM